MQEYFWSISIEEGIIQAAIWTIRENSATVFRTSEPQLYEDDESLITAADTCLSSCIQDLPEGITEPTKTTFGVPSFWVRDGQIERQYLDRIKLICDKLSLKPVGFVPLPEALAHFEKSQEKTPMSAILVAIYSQDLEISLFRLGNMAGSVKVGRSTNISDDVNEGLTRFGGSDAFPSRFLLYGLKENDLEEIKQSLIQTDWDTNPNVKFLHTPQIELINDESKMAAISLAGAAELNATADISFGEKEKKSEEAMNLEEVSNIEGVVDPASLGFTLNQDVSLPPEENFLPLKKKPLKIKLPNFNSNLPFVAAIFVLIVIVAGIFSWVVLAKAQVTISLTPYQIQEKKQIKFDTGANSVDLASLKVPAKQISTSVSGDKTKSASGTLTIGKPAKGSVTFYNVGGATTIAAGTTLSSSNLAFSLDNDVPIASASGAASAATAQGTITADALGADSNLAQGSYFTISGISSSLIQAKNDSALTGGSSQEVTAVSKDDEATLTTNLTKELTDNGRNNLKSNLNPPYLLIDSSLTNTTTSHSLDPAINSQATTAKLSETIKVSGLEVSRDDMDNLAKQLFSGKIPDGYTLNETQIDFDFQKDGVNFIVNLLPNIDKSKLSSQIQGKNIDTARNILSKLSGFSDVVFSIKPNLPFLKLLPFLRKNITLEVTSKQ